MTVLELINQMNREQLTEFIYMLLSGCECGVGDCPLENLGSFDSLYFGCTSERLSQWLDSECSETQIKQFLG